MNLPAQPLLILIRRVAVGLLAAILIIAAPSPAVGQSYGPAGNTHPEHEHALTDEQSPFGPVMSTSAQAPLTVAQKLAFANDLDLRPFKDLAVYHNGRIKILDSLAGEIVSGLVGRRNFQDLLPDASGKLKKVGFDPLFTFMDLAIDPLYYADKPLVHVYFLPLREKLLQAAIPGSTPDVLAERERWLKLGRLKPTWIARHMGPVSNTMTLDGAAARSAGDINSAMRDIVDAGKLWLVIPSSDLDKPWSHLVSADAKAHPEIAAAAASLGASWRRADASGVNAAVLTLSKSLPALDPAAYPTFRRTIEQAYNRSNAFEYGAWLYAVSFIFLLLAIGTARPWLRNIGIALLLLAIGLHSFGFFARCFIAERFAIQNQFESMTGVSLFAAVIGLALALSRKQVLFAAATAAVGFMILITATQTGIPGREINREAAILNTSVLLKYHVSIVLLSYGLISLGFIVSIFYLVSYYTRASLATSAGGGSPGGGSGGQLAISSGDNVDVGGTGEGNARLLPDLDRAQIILMQMAFWTLGVGIMLGAWWADHSWGRWWAFDPKELWALLTWLVYLIVVHVRVGGVRNRGFVTAWLSVLGFLVMLFCYFGVNLMLPGLHAYA